MKRQAILLVVATATTILLGVGIAAALTKTCGGGDCVGSQQNDQLTGTTSNDRIAELEGNDTITEPATGTLSDNDEIFGGGGNDVITDNQGANDNDRIFGDAGNDIIDVDESGDNVGGEIVDCGPGKKDKVFADSFDQLTHCEIKKINQPH